jgi:hypothetical protein
MGRWSNERRAQEAAKAGAKAMSAAKSAQPAAKAMPATPGKSEAAPEANTRPEGFRPEPRNEPRRLMMEEIASRHERTSGYAPAPEAGTEPAPEPQAAEPVPPTPDEQLAADAAAAAKARPAPEPAAEPKAEPAPQPEPVKMVKVKVDGEEFEVSQADIDDAGGVGPYRIARASENRLKRTNESLAETRKLQAQIAEMVKAQMPKEPVITDDQFIASKVDAIRFGTPEESAAALREVLARTSPKVDPQAITRQAVNEMMRLNAVDNFKKEFQDVVSDPMLLRLAVALENERNPQTGPQTDWAEHYRKIGNEVRSVKGRPSQPAAVTAVPAAPATDSPSPADREARKAASIVNLPTAAARAALPAEAKPETREQILDQMRKSRGIPTG